MTNECIRRLLIGTIVLMIIFAVTHIFQPEIALLVAAIALFFLPPSIDPAIIIKEVQIAAGTHPESL